MRVGVTAMLTDTGIDPASLAVACEERGFEGLYLPEHTHMPLDRAVEHPIADELPDEYRRTLDPFVALSMAAAVTTSLRLGTGVLLLGQRDPIVTAKEIATLDHLSGGRVVLGLGYGWNREELADHGVAWSDRRAVIHERLEVMRRLWAQDIAAFDGDHERLAPSQAWPKPAAGTVPIWLGVAPGPRNFAAVVEVADAWIPHGSSGLPDGMQRLAVAAEAAGRDPASVAVVPFGVLPTPGKLEHLASLGIEQIVTLVNHDRDEAMRMLDDHAAVLDQTFGPGGWRPDGAAGSGSPPSPA